MIWVLYKKEWAYILKMIKNYKYQDFNRIILER